MFDFKLCPAKFNIGSVIIRKFGTEIMVSKVTILLEGCRNTYEVKFQTAVNDFCCKDILIG